VFLKKERMFDNVFNKMMSM